jgi:hypothetical protein
MSSRFVISTTWGRTNPVRSMVLVAYAYFE